MIKVAYIGDSPFIHSGFGIVANSIMSRWPDEFEIYVHGIMAHVNPRSLGRYKYYMPVCIHDLMGFKSSIDFIQEANPDVLFVVGDPGTLRNRFATLMLSGLLTPMPTVSYFPIEGLPISKHFVEQAIMVFAPVTYTKMGQTELAKLGAKVDYAYHGVDHANFTMYPEDIRRKLRAKLNWHDKFVIGFIGVNKRSNRLPALIEMLAQLVDSGIRDIVLYLHTEPRGDAFMGGWELDWYIERLGVQDYVQFKVTKQKYIGLKSEAALEETLKLPKAKNKEEVEKNLARFDYISLMNCFDLYIDPASAHGWNLPASEVIRCGVPVAMTNDGFARKEIYEGYVYMVEPSAIDYWHTGAHLPLVSVDTMVNAVTKLMYDSKLRQELASKAKERFDQLLWQPTADLFAQKIREAYEFRLRLSKDGQVLDR